MCSADQHRVCGKMAEEGAEEKVLQPTLVAAGPEQAEKRREEVELTSGTLFKCPANQLTSSHVGQTRRLPL